jgi:tetratricopeptide (TPR) repeat protein
MTEAKDADTPGTKVLRLSNYLNRAHRHDKPSILFALYLSEFLRSDVERSLSTLLKVQGLRVVSVDAGEKKDLPSFFSSIDSDNTVFFVHNIEKGFPEALQFLNFKRENLVEDHVKVLFWVTEEELSRISREAPDFFAFRNRVVEFMELPHVGETRPALVEFALDTEYKSLDEIKRNIELKEKLLAELSTETEISGYLLGSLGILYGQIGFYEKSIECSGKALKIAREMGNRRGNGATLGNLGNAYLYLGQAEKAIKYYEDALVIARGLGDRHNEGTHLGQVGTAYLYLGQAEKASKYYEDALAIAREIGDRRNEGVWLGNLGSVYRDLEQVEKAIEYHEDALTIAREIGDRRGEGNHLGNLGNAYHSLGQAEKAIRYYEDALAVLREIGDRNSEGAVLGNIGNAYLNLGQVDKAIEYHEAALVIAREIGDRRNEGVWLGNLGLNYHALGQVDKAIEYYENALTIGKEIKDPRIIDLCEKNLISLKNSGD